MPPVIHGPILISLSDLNGFEFGTKVRNPYQSFFERKPDAIIANGIGVFNGDFAVPQAASLAPVWRAKEILDDDDNPNPSAALAQALQALAIEPDSFDGQIYAGDALHALHRDAEARVHYEHAMKLVDTMEPTSQQKWRPEIAEKLDDLDP